MLHLWEIKYTAIMPKQESDTVYFPAYLHVIPVITFFLLFFGFTAIEKLLPILIIVLVVNTGVFIYQLYFLSKVMEPRRVYKAERDLLIASLLVLGGLVAGNVMGYNEFSDVNNVSLHEGLRSAIFGYLCLLALLISLLALANVFYLYLPPDTILYALGKLGLFILWLAIFVISFFGYVVTYALYDPSTE